MRVVSINCQWQRDLTIRTVLAHYLLQTRTAVLNGELRDQYKQWYPSMKVEDAPSEDEEEFPMAA